MGVAVFWCFGEQSRVEHGRIAKELMLLFGGQEGSGQHAPDLSWKPRNLWLVGRFCVNCCSSLDSPRGRKTHKLRLVHHRSNDVLRATDALVESPAMKLRLFGHLGCRGRIALCCAQAGSRRGGRRNCCRRRGSHRGKGPERLTMVEEQPPSEYGKGSHGGSRLYTSLSNTPLTFSRKKFTFVYRATCIKI